MSEALLFLKKKRPKNFCSWGMLRLFRIGATSTVSRSEIFLVLRAGRLFFKRDLLAFFGWDFGVTPGLLRFARHDECCYV
jgi:hypothetical protein